MQKASPSPVPTETQLASLSPVEIRGILQSQAQTIDALKHQLEWFRRQMFGTKSERLAVLEDAWQLPLQESG
jgi:transposase